MKLKMLLILAMSVSAFSLSARTVSKTKSFSYKVTADSEDLLTEKIQEALPEVRLGKGSDHFGCRPVIPRQAEIKNVTIDKQYNVDSNDNLIPFYVGKIYSSQKFKCRESNN